MEEKYLYKAKRKNWEEWIPEQQWMQGNLIVAQDRYFIIECAKIDRYDALYMKEYAEIDPSTICRYTGLLDKNKNLIWENDIITISGYSYEEPEETHYGVVSDSDWNAGFCLVCENKWLPICELEGDYKTEYFKHGNIYDNTELLKYQSEEQIEQE